MKVSEIMTRDVSTCRESDSLDRAAALMWARDCGIVPVLSERHQLVAVITDRDIAMAAHFEGKPLAHIGVANAMSKELHVCSESESVDDAEERMSRAQVRRLPVVDAHERVVGILSLSDIARASERSHARQGVSPAGVAQTLATIGQPRNAVQQPGSPSSP